MDGISWRVIGRDGREYLSSNFKWSQIPKENISILEVYIGSNLICRLKNQDQKNRIFLQYFAVQRVNSSRILDQGLEVGYYLGELKFKVYEVSKKRVKAFIVEKPKVFLERHGMEE